MIIENRSKNLQRFNFEGKAIVLEIGNNTLAKEEFEKLKSHRLYESMVNASILKVVMPPEITETKEVVETEVAEEVLKEERTEEAEELSEEVLEEPEVLEKAEATDKSSSSEEVLEPKIAEAIDIKVVRNNTKRNK